MDTTNMISTWYLVQTHGSTQQQQQQRQAMPCCALGGRGYLPCLVEQFSEGNVGNSKAHPREAYNASSHPVSKSLFRTVIIKQCFVRNFLIFLRFFHQRGMLLTVSDSDLLPSVNFRGLGKYFLLIFLFCLNFL